MVFAKMSGYPQWPAFITPQELIPNSVLKVKKKGTDYCVMFIPDGDFYWVTDKSLEPLTQQKLEKSLKDIPEEIKKQAKELKGKKRGKQSNIKEAIAAADGLDFETFIRAFNEDAMDEDDDEEEEEEEEEEGEPDAQEEHAPDNDAVLEEEPTDKTAKDELKKSKKGSKKEDTNEKGESEPDEIDSSEGIRTTRNGKTRASIPKKPAATTTTPTPTASTASTRNGRNNKRKASPEQEEEPETKPTSKRHRTPPKSDSTKTGESNDENENNDSTNDNVGDTSSNTTPAKSNNGPKTTEGGKDEKLQQLWLCRVKLQRSLIQRNQPTTPKDTSKLKPPTADELLVARLILYRLGDFPITTELLKETKIHKVLKCILRDPSMEYPDSFKLHERCEELLHKWDPVILTLKSEKLSGSGGHSLHRDRLASSGPKNEEKEKNAVIFKNGLSVNKKTNQQNDDSEVSALEQSILEIEAKKNEHSENDKRKLEDARTPTSVEI